MSTNMATDQLFEFWKKQFEQGTEAWTRIAGQRSPATEVFDPLKFWRPMFDQLLGEWSKAVQQGAMTPDVLKQWKGFLDQWLLTWDKMFAELFQTDAFAEIMGKQLQQWLSVQMPFRQGATASMETTLQALGLPSRAQVVGIARQLMELDDRLEDIENRLTALNSHLSDTQHQKTADRRETARRPARSKKRRPHARTTN
jgi:hypothetical protein